MTKKNLVNFDVFQLKEIYNKNLSWLVTMAVKSKNKSDFIEDLKEYFLLKQSLNDHSNQIKSSVIIRILTMLDYEGKEVFELSMGKTILISSFSYLWEFLKGNANIETSKDVYIDFYKMFSLLEFTPTITPEWNYLQRQMKRWSTGLDEEVQIIRARNKERIIHLLIKKIERRHSPNSKYIFSEQLSWNEKYEKVKEWWNESRFHLAMAVKSPAELNWFLDNSISEETMHILVRAKKKNMPFFVTPYYLSLLNVNREGFDDETIRTYVIYSKDLVDTYGNIHAWEKEDIVISGKPNAAGWLLPEGHNIHRRYPEVAILIPDSMGRACGGLCASCQRMYDFQSERLNFDFESLRPKETWDKKLRRLMRYFEEDTQLRDILITGGDALMSQNKTLRHILDAVYKMAERKQKANLYRPDGQKYAELQRVRLGSRLLAYLPLRINDELVDILREFKLKASRVGVSQFIIQTHFQSPLEVTPEAQNAIKAILSAGWIITNQLVYTVAASRRGHTTKLRQVLNKVGVICYYTFSVKGFSENYAMFAPNSRSIQEAKEEKRFGLVPKEKEQELLSMTYDGKNIKKDLMSFLKENKLPFISTDRNVLNLPAIGKSMTFTTIGLTNSGKRILKFDHDSGRKHSPIINQMGEVFIVENKSIAAYLRQLAEMGEKIEEYDSIWSYGDGKTESRSLMYEYPDFSFEITSDMTNLQIS